VDHAISTESSSDPRALVPRPDRRTIIATGIRAQITSTTVFATNTELISSVVRNVPTALCHPADIATPIIPVLIMCTANTAISTESSSDPWALALRPDRRTTIATGSRARITSTAVFATNTELISSVVRTVPPALSHPADIATTIFPVLIISTANTAVRAESSSARLAPAEVSGHLVASVINRVLATYTHLMVHIATITGVALLFMAYVLEFDHLGAGNGTCGGRVLDVGPRGPELESRTVPKK